MQFFETFLKILKVYLFLSFRLHLMIWIVSIQTFKFEYFRATGSWVRAGLVSTKGLSEAGVSSARLPGPCQDQCGDPGHPLSQWQGVLYHNEHVLQVIYWLYNLDFVQIVSKLCYPLDCSVQWQESRIVTKKDIEPGFWYPMSLEFLDLIWTPNIFIYNLKSFNSAKVLNRLAGICPNIYNESWQILLIKASG